MRQVDDRPDEAFERDLPWRKSTAFVFRLIARHPFVLAAAVVSSFGVAAADLLSLALIFPFISALQGSAAVAMPSNLRLAFLVPYFSGLSPVGKIQLIAVALFAIQTGKALFSYVNARIGFFLEIVLERDMRHLVFDQALELEMRYLNKERMANLFTIMHTYPRQSADIGKEWVSALPKLLTFGALLFVMVEASWQLTLIALALGTLTLVAISGITKVVRRLSRRTNNNRVRLHQVTLESLGAMKMIRLFGREEHTRSRFAREVDELQRGLIRMAAIGSAAGPIYTILTTALFSLLMILATFVLQPTGEGLLLLVGFIAGFVRITGPLGDFNKRRTRVATRLPSIEAVMSFVEKGDKPFLKDGEREFEELRDRVRFEDVAFRYDEDGEDVIRRVTFDIEKGRTTALVGGSGAGKSTIINLLARIYDPTSGAVKVDGVDVREFRARSWRTRLAVVSQDTFLFNATVRENIRFGRLDATDEEVEEAARQAHAHEFILQMEQGYDTSVGDRGVRLSGGQAQRIAIARAILAQPQVLVLDEATSALDTATERLVQEAIENVSRGRTVVAVAHRLSTVRHADKIVILEQGQVVEQGSHDELMAAQGAYAHFVGLQSLDPREDAPLVTVRVAPSTPSPSASSPTRPAATRRAQPERAALPAPEPEPPTPPAPEPEPVPAAPQLTPDEFRRRVDALFRAPR